VIASQLSVFLYGRGSLVGGGRICEDGRRNRVHGEVIDSRVDIREAGSDWMRFGGENGRTGGRILLRYVHLISDSEK
jgi:hypothetical protein